jgi:hypothetical protein
MNRMVLLAVALATATPALPSPARQGSQPAAHHGRGDRNVKPAERYTSTVAPTTIAPVSPQYESPLPSAFNRCGSCGASGT